MEGLEKLFLLGCAIIGVMSLSLSSFATQDQQIAGKGGFDAETSKPMIFAGYLVTALVCGLSWYVTGEKVFVYAGLALVLGGYAWVYMVKHPIWGSK